MSDVLRILDSGMMPARRNIAATAALAELHRDGRSPDTLRFHVYPRSVLIGRHQVFAEAVNADYCRRNGLEVARRVTGGGAVFMSPGILAFDVVADKRRFGESLALAAARVCTGVVAGLAQLNVSARRRPPNAIDIAGRKVCGAGGAFDGPTLAYQGALLVAFDIDDMTGALAQVHEEMISLSEAMARVPAMEEIKSELTAGIAAAWQGKTVRGTMTAEEQSLSERLFADEIGCDAFVIGDIGRQTPPQTEPLSAA
jgi:lipoate---protein ligase